jgi:hypothetical protein
MGIVSSGLTVQLGQRFLDEFCHRQRISNILKKNLYRIDFFRVFLHLNFTPENLFCCGNEEDKCYILHLKRNIIMTYYDFFVVHVSGKLFNIIDVLRLIFFRGWDVTKI